MNPEWNDFLQGYKIEHNHEFGNNTLCDLTDFDLITCDGNDADTFLQGQLTNDIKEVTENQAQLSAYCSQKGRMYAVFLILKALPRSLTSSLKRSLKGSTNENFMFLGSPPTL